MTTQENGVSNTPKQLQAINGDIDWRIEDESDIAWNARDTAGLNFSASTAQWSAKGEYRHFIEHTPTHLWDEPVEMIEEEVPIYPSDTFGRELDDSREDPLAIGKVVLLFSNYELGNKANGQKTVPEEFTEVSLR